MRVATSRIEDETKKSLSSQIFPSVKVCSEKTSQQINGSTRTSQIPSLYKLNYKVNQPGLFFKDEEPIFKKIQRKKQAKLRGENPIKIAYQTQYGVSTDKKDEIKAPFRTYKRNEATQNVLNPAEYDYDCWPKHKNSFIRDGKVIVVHEETF